MKKKNLIIAICLFVFCFMFTACSADNESSIKVDTVDDMKELVNSIYEISNPEIMALETNEIDLSDEYALTSYTGLEDDSNVKNIVVSESMTGSTAYSLVLVKVNDSSKLEDTKKEMVDNIDMRKWICVGADIVYASSYEDVIFLVMSNEEDAKAQYDAFVSVVGKNRGKDLTREAEALDF